MDRLLANAISRQFLTIAAQASVKDAIALLTQTNHPCLFVVDPISLKLEGLFTDRDVVRLTATDVDHLTTPLSSVLRPAVPVWCESELPDLNTVLSLVQQFNILPLVNDQDQPVGLMTANGLLEGFRAQAGDTLLLSESLPDFPSQNPGPGMELPLRQHLDRALVLQKIINAIHTQSNPQEFFETTVTQIGQLFEVDGCQLLAYTPEPAAQLTLTAGYSQANAERQTQGHWQVQHPYLLKALSQDQAVAVSVVDADLPFLTLTGDPPLLPIQSLLAVRTAYQGTPSGLLVLYQVGPERDWTLGEVRLLEAIAAQVSIVLTQIKLLEQEKQQRAALDQQNLRLQQEIRERQLALRDLQQAEERLELFFAQSLDGFFFMMLDQPVRWDGSIDRETTLDYVFAHHRITKVNDAMLEQYGATREEFLGLTPRELFAHDLAAGREVWARFFDAGTLHVETNERKVDGSEVWIEGDYHCLYDSDGRIIGHFGVQRDVSDRKQVEDFLKRQQKFLRNVIDTPPNLIFAKDWDGQFVLANQATAEIYGTTVEELIGKGDQNFNPNLTEVEQFLQADREVIWTQQPKLIEEFVTAASGETRCFQTIKKPITAIDGESTLVLGVATDITDRKQIEQALRLIVEGTAAKTGSEFFHSLVRYLAEVLQVRYAFVTELIQPERRKARTLAFWRGDDFGENFEYELAGTPCQQILEGETIYYQDSIQLAFPTHQHLADLEAESYFGIPLHDSLGSLIGHVKVLDTRPFRRSEFSEQILRIFAARAGAELERKQAEDVRSALLAQTQEQSIALEKARDAAEAANRAKSEFLANMSHELRTPLNAILGFTQIMSRDACLSLENQEYVNIINRSGQHLLTLINDVLEMSKIEAGRIKLHPATFNFHYLLGTLQEMLRLKANAKQLALTFACPANLPQYITTDEGKLRQVLLNLLGNAIKFTQTGSVTLQVEVKAARRTDTTLSPHVPIHLQFEVQDTGPGITPEDIQRLFTPFVQTDAGQQSFEGTGLGLTISQKFIQLMGGTITVESVVNQGSTFRFDIQATSATVSPSPISYSTQRVIGLQPDQPSYRILIVEDHWENQQILVKLLQPLGFTIQIAGNGQEGIQVWENWCPHVILMDMRMPVLNGYQAIPQIRAKEQQGAGVAGGTKIIAVTSSAFEEERSGILELGCDDFISKPYREEEIFAKLAEHIGVQYLYEQKGDRDSSGAIASPSGAVLAAAVDGLDWTREALSLDTLPIEWIRQVRHAAILGKDEQLFQLIAHLPSTHARLAHGLRQLVNDFNFEVIVDLTAPLDCD